MEAADCVFLACLSLFSSGWYVGRLGFHSDDWGLFAAFSLSAHDTLIGQVRSGFLDRPLQGVYSIALFRLFGLTPLGYHIVNALVIAVLTVLVYLTMTSIQRSRTVAVGAALVYAVLPMFSTDRFWFAVFAGPLCMALALLSILIDIRTIHLTGSRFVLGRAASIAAMLSSVMMYEVAMPFLLLSPLVAMWKNKRLHAARDWAVVVLPNVLLLGAVAIYKTKTSPRLHAPNGLPALMWSIASHMFQRDFKTGDYGLNVWAALRTGFVDYLFWMPRTVWTLQARYPHAWLPAASLLFGLGVFAYLATARFDLTLRRSLATAAWGVVVFAAGYAMFLTNTAIQITPTGIGNRTSIAAALGVAIAACGCFGALASLARSPRAKTAIFAGLAGAYAASGFFVISTLSTFWIDGYAREREVVHDVEAHLQPPLARTTVLLAGVCPYNGPAIIFESDWDLSGALQLHYGERTLSADVLRPGFYSFTDRGVATILYEGEDDYDYGGRLLAYDYIHKSLQPLTDAGTARRWLSAAPRDAECAPAYEGVGARVF